jgi:predicted RNase H-like HicB family nuclease
MLIDFRFEYWIEDNWYVGHLKDVPGVFSQGETLQELEENIKDAYYMMRASSETDSREPNSHITKIGIEV